MGKIDTSGWKEFRIGDYFKVEYGRFHAKDELGTGTVNYITTSGFNNGITNTCEEATHQGNCITVASDGAMGASFYQEEAFTTSNIVSTLTPLPHTPLNKYNALFLCAIIFGKRAEFGWLGFKMSVDRVRNLRVKLPATPDGAPDWAYMESYMANIETRVAESLTLLQAAKDAEKKKVDTREWGEFRVGELFDAFLSKDDIQPKAIVEGNTPLVSSGKENNGIIAFIDNKNARLWEANTLTVDMFGKVFYQGQPYYAVSHGRVNILMPRMSMAKHCMQFIGCAIERVTTDKYAFSEMCTGTKLLKNVIMLPKDKTGQPDWVYMEEYMRKVEARVKVTMGKYEITLNEVVL